MTNFDGNEKIIPELEKDVQRLLLITDRFGKIGSKPILEEKNGCKKHEYLQVVSWELVFI